MTGIIGIFRNLLLNNLGAMNNAKRGYMTKKRVLGKFILTVLGMSVISQIIHSAGAVLTMDYYKDPQYFQVWSKIMMPGAEPPPVSFFAYSFLFSLLGWVNFLALFRMSKEWIPGRGPVSILWTS